MRLGGPVAIHDSSYHARYIRGLSEQFGRVDLRKRSNLSHIDIYIKINLDVDALALLRTDAQRSTYKRTLVPSRPLPQGRTKSGSRKTNNWQTGIDWEKYTCQVKPMGIIFSDSLMDIIMRFGMLNPTLTLYTYTHTRLGPWTLDAHRRGRW